MKVKLVECPCDNPVMHRKWENESGYQTSPLYSVTQARYFIRQLKAKGHMDEAEYVEAAVQLAASGLPEYGTVADETLVQCARAVVVLPEDEREAVIVGTAEEFGISPADTDRIRELVADPDKLEMKAFLSELGGALAPERD